MPDNPLRPLGNFLKQFDRQPDRYNSDELFDFLSLVKGWSEITSEKFAAHTTPLKLTNKALTILTDHSVFAQQLALTEQLVIKKIEKSFPALKGKISKLFYQTNPGHFLKLKERRDTAEKPAPQKMHKYSPEFKSLESQAREYFRDLEGQEIYETLVSLYIQSRLNQLADDSI